MGSHLEDNDDLEQLPFILRKQSSMRGRTMNVRTRALESVAARKGREGVETFDGRRNPAETFGCHVFNRNVMQRMLPPAIYENVINAMEGREKIQPEYADVIAGAMKDWAIDLGATHYTHWFQPLTGMSAEKHDAFIDWHTPDRVIERFIGRQLLQGEPDASSFPSGGLRSTFEARGYTGWDPSSPVFVWKTPTGVTLCVPSVFFSWNGEALDQKLPLLRSERKLCDAVLRLLKMTGIQAKTVFCTLGFEQEYFIIDRTLREFRPDLALAGRTVFGASSPKGQELQDHYFGAVKERVLAFMDDFEAHAFDLGIPVKTRHNEVAPAQHEVAPVFERASVAVDHNILLMEIMRKVASRHKLSCLLHEKPFAGLNGSGKHANWSLATDTGINLLNPTDTPENNWHFLVLLAAVLCGVHRHAGLLRASVGSASNDLRLGGHEAPPAIMSVYMGEVLDNLIDTIVKGGQHKSAGKKYFAYDLGLSVIPDLPKDNSDRNRTSPFAFTGNKFEFRAVGGSSNPAFAITTLNSIVAESLIEILDEVQNAAGKTAVKPIPEFLTNTLLPIIRKFLKQSQDIRFSGDNYSAAWAKEAQKRRLPNIHKSIHAFDELISPETVKVFQGVMSKDELHSRFEVFAETYGHHIDIESKLMVELFSTHVLPAALRFQKDIAKSINQTNEALGKAARFTEQKDLLGRVNKLIEEGSTLARELERVRQKSHSLPNIKRAKAFCDHVVPAGDKLREVADGLEKVVDDELWTLPKYREILFSL